MNWPNKNHAAFRGAIVAVALLALGSADAQSGSIRFGCQARTFGEGVYKDEAAFLSVVERAGEVGFDGIETNWKNLERYFEKPAHFERLLNKSRLTLIGAHMGGSPWARAGLPALLKDVERTAQFVRNVGGSCVVFSGSVPKEKAGQPDTWLKMAALANDIGRVCAANGVRFLYHNHWWECEGDGLDTLCRLTDPKLVGFAFDTGHALRAGKDPAAVIGSMAKRLGLIHFADFSAESATSVKRPPLGEGCLKIPATVEALRKAGFDQWIVLEEETTAATARPLAEKGLAVLRTAFRQKR